MLEVQKHNNFVENKLTEINYNSHNFNEIPPIIGIITADQYGNTIMVFDYDSNKENNYKSIKSYLSGGEKNLLEIDLISMYLSSFKIFAGQTNIQNLSHLEIYGSNIKVQIYFLFEKYMIIVFLNTNTKLNSREKAGILEYLKEKLVEYEHQFTNFNETNSRKIIGMVEGNGKKWFKKLNKDYIQAFKNLFLKKHEEIEKSMTEIGLIIQNELYEYLEYVPDEILNNVSKELKNKIQDKLFEFDHTLSKNPEKNMD